MNWREKIVCDWPNDLQKAHRCKEALASLDRVLSELAGMGHPLHVEEGYVPPPPPGWPRAMFHIMAGSRVVNCQADLEELGEDWYPTMEAARHAAGLTKQYQRGGIFDKALPSLLGQTPEQVRQSLVEDLERKEATKRLVDEVRASNRMMQEQMSSFCSHFNSNTFK